MKSSPDNSLAAAAGSSCSSSHLETWSYQEKKYHDKKGGRWHFMFHSRYLRDRAPEEQPYALYFRDDERKVFGVLRFDRAKDNPYRSLDTVTRKIMDDVEFRATLLEDGSKRVWRGR